MKKFVASLFIFVAASHAAYSQTPTRKPAAAPNPPQPVLTKDANDERLRALFNSAREALAAMRFDEALRLSDEGIAASPEEPAFWLNRSNALYARGAVTHNRFYRSSDETERKAGLEASKRDFRDSLAAATRGLALLDNYPASDDEAYRTSFASLRRAALWLRAQALFTCATRVDESYYMDALTAFEQYAAAEIDPSMLSIAHYFTGQLMIATNDSAGAAIEFRKVLEAEPDNFDAMLGEAVSLITQGNVAGDPAKLREGFERLRLFVEKSPESNPVRASAARALEYYKNSAPPKEEAVAENSAVAAAGRPVEGGVINGRSVSKPAPAYPLVAKFARAKGPVSVRILVNEQGEVVSAWAASGHPLLQAAAVDAASQAKFTPTLLSGRPVKVTGTITYNFVLE